MTLLECFPIEGSDGWTADLALLCCCASTLLLKQLFYETPDRTWTSFLLDTSKQAAGAAVVLVLFRNATECYLYLAGTLVESTFGVFMEYVLLNLLTSAVRATSGQDKIFSIGDYEDERGNISQMGYLAQLGIWLLCVTVTRAALTPVVPSSLAQQQGAETSVPRVFVELEQIIVVFVVPCIMRSFQVWVVDDFLKHSGSPAMLRVLKQRALAQAAVIDDVITRYTSRPTLTETQKPLLKAEEKIDEEKGLLPEPVKAAAASSSGSPPLLPFPSHHTPTRPAVVSSTPAAALAAAAEPTAPVPPVAAPTATPAVAAAAPVASIAAGSVAAAAAAATGTNEQAPIAPSKIMEVQEVVQPLTAVSSAVGALSPVREIEPPVKPATPTEPAKPAEPVVAEDEVVSRPSGLRRPSQPEILTDDACKSPVRLPGEAQAERCDNSGVGLQDMGIEESLHLSRKDLEDEEIRRYRREREIAANVNAGETAVDGVQPSKSRTRRGSRTGALENALTSEADEERKLREARYKAWEECKAAEAMGPVGSSGSEGVGQVRSIHTVDANEYQKARAVDKS
mmetsp:Transcript_42715/g.91615  ORF Transcript_42715/g.91615 Transcript_42715/m.91615 type:complete len:568 (-) Transcript_42715:189-1892(-)